MMRAPPGPRVPLPPRRPRSPSRRTAQAPVIAPEPGQCHIIPVRTGSMPHRPGTGRTPARLAGSLALWMPRLRCGRRRCGQTVFSSGCSRPDRARWRCACTGFLTRRIPGGTCCLRWPAPGSTRWPRSCAATRRPAIPADGAYQHRRAGRRRGGAARGSGRRRGRGADRARLGSRGRLRGGGLRAGPVAQAGDPRRAARRAWTRCCSATTSSSSGSSTCSCSAIRPGSPEAVVASDDMAFLDGLWRDWSPGFRRAGEHLAQVKECLRRAGQPGRRASATTGPRAAPASP